MKKNKKNKLKIIKQYKEIKKLKNKIKSVFFLIVDQNCRSDLHIRWRAARAARYLIYFII